MKPDTEEIINQAGVEKVVEMIREALSPALFDECERLGVDTEAIIRYMPLAERFKEERGRSIAFSLQPEIQGWISS